MITLQMCSQRSFGLKGKRSPQELGLLGQERMGVGREGAARSPRRRIGNRIERRRRLRDAVDARSRLHQRIRQCYVVRIVRNQSVGHDGNGFRALGQR